MSDPHKWDRWDSTAARPLTRRRLAYNVAFRLFTVVLISALAVGALLAAFHSPSRSSWTLFGIAALAWLIVVAIYVWLTVLLVKLRRRRPGPPEKGPDGRGAVSSGTAPEG